MTSTNGLVVVFGFAALTFAACDSRNLDSSDGGAGTSGTGTGGAAGTIGTGGTINIGGAGGASCAGTRVSPPGTVPAEHRAVATACSPSNAPPLDGGAMSCTTNADCSPDGSAAWNYNTCLHGVCSFDLCLTDADCGSSYVCACSSDYYGGNAAYHPNICVPSNCRVDADCGAGGYCSPSRGYCGTFQGFYCHGPSDTCVDATADCAACGISACVYAPTVGAFVCGSSICAG
jgi:hypothetical protein